MLSVYVVASELDLVEFDLADDFVVVQSDLSGRFGIRPTDPNDLLQCWVKRRPDLLIGMVDRRSKLIVVGAGTIALAPRSSTTVRRATELLKLNGCRRVLTEPPPNNDSWITELGEMYGAIPPELFHGTSDKYLDSIQAKGLIVTGEPNWERSASGHISLAATAQIAALHARETAAKIGGNPIVLTCHRPATLLPDWDVKRCIIDNPEVPSEDEQILTREAGLFGTPEPIPADQIIRISEPALRIPYTSWKSIII
ncbi:MAG: hypothetical protein JWR00_627 [Rubritepida sp.]|nr:hypothetical protein [Rubritepida sp.]